MEGQSPQVQDTVFSYLFSLLLLISPFPSLAVILQNKILPFLVPLFPQLQNSHLLALSHIGLVATNYQANIPDAQLQLSQCWMIWITVKSRPQHGFFSGSPWPCSFCLSDSSFLHWTQDISAFFLSVVTQNIFPYSCMFVFIEMCFS